TDPTGPLKSLAAGLHSRSFIVLISDLLQGEEHSIKLLQQMRAMGHQVIVFHTMDHDEMTLPFEGASEFVDAESGASLLTDPGVIRDTYVAAVKKYIEWCRKQYESHGIDYALLTTKEPLDKALAAYLLR